MRVVGNERGRGPAGERVGDEVGAAADRDEEVALLDPAGVDLHPGHLVGPRPGGEPPERLDQVELERDHGRPPCGAASSRATSRSSNGTLPGRELLLRLGAASGDHDDVSGRGLAEGALDRGTPVELELERAGAARGDLGSDRGRLLAARVVGCQDRPVGEAARRPRPISGRLARSRSPPAPKTTVRPPVAEPARLVRGRFERVRRVRVVDDHGEGLAALDRLEATRDARDRLDSAPITASRSIPSAPAASAAPIAFSRLKAAAQLELDPREGVEAASKVIASGSSAARRLPRTRRRR